MTIKPVIYRSEAEMERLVEAFENGSLAPAEFSHHAHMTVAMWYLQKYPFADAVDRMRSTTKHFAERHQQHQLYNETITLFWMKLLDHLLKRADPAASLPDTVQEIITRWGSMGFVFKHYSKEHVNSAEAKQSWVEPDLLPLGFEN
jgi:hypothetical protein